ncbi:MAG TPA: hypothetical protein VHG93_02165 [Longimicrobium sp.]|nr:hypothetical protein [Longimicrobium sp.]
MRSLYAVIASVSLCAGAPLAAQPAAEPPDADDWNGEVATLTLNALLGGVTAGTVRALRGGSFGEGFALGAAGGALVYTGKRIAVQGWDGAGLAGREVAALGTSVIRNTADGRAPLERLVLPLWIGRVYVTTGPRLSVQPRLDLATTVSTVYQALDSRSRIDLPRSLSAGAPVFRVYTAEEEWIGFQRAGVVLLRYNPGYRGIEEQLPLDLVAPLERSAAHERVHVAQLDQAFLLVTAPLEDWLLDRFPAAERIRRWVDPGIAGAPLYLTELLIPYDSRPWEREADFLARQAR